MPCADRPAADRMDCWYTDMQAIIGPRVHRPCPEHWSPSNLNATNHDYDHTLRERGGHVNNHQNPTTVLRRIPRLPLSGSGLDKLLMNVSSQWSVVADGSRGEQLPVLLKKLTGYHLFLSRAVHGSIQSHSHLNDLSPHANILPSHLIPAQVARNRVHLPTRYREHR